MPSFTPARATVGALLGLTLLSTSLGCAAPAKARRDAAVLAQVYHLPDTTVRAQVRAELIAEGHTLVPTEDDGLIHTDWKYLIDGQEFASVRERYAILVKRLTAEHCRVEAVRISLSTLAMDANFPTKPNVPAEVLAKTPSLAVYGRSPSPPSVPRAYGRDPGFEWRLLRRIDPAKAERIEALALGAGR